MAFKFTQTDFKLCDGNKNNSKLLRERLLELYEELLPKLEADSVLRRFVRLSTPHHGLRTKSPYVPYYWLRDGGGRPGSWVGFADTTKYPDPRIGIQFQYGLLSKRRFWYGIWIQGDQGTRKSENELLNLLNYDLSKIATSIKELGSGYWVKMTKDSEEEPFINISADKFSTRQAEEWRDSLEEDRLWIAIDKNLDLNELLEIDDIPSDIMKTTHELLGLYRLLTPGGMTEKEALDLLKRGETVMISDDVTVPTSEREGVANTRVGQSAIRKITLEVYGHQCALCDLKSDSLLRASHIVPWVDDEKNRGNPKNVICLCASHDLMFERGLLRIRPNYKVEFDERSNELKKSSAMFGAIHANTFKTMRLPSTNRPDPGLLEKKLHMKESNFD